MKKLLIIFAVLFIAISAFAQIPGSTYENPLPVTLPLSGYTGDTSLYGDDYESGWVSPSFNYLGGDDMVLEFTLAEDSYLSGTLASTDGGTWIGMCVVNQAPDSANPAPTFARASSSGSSATMAATALPAGTYALIISTWPTPQSFQFTLDLIATPVPTTPELSVTPDQWSFGNLNINNTASKLFTLSNTGGGSLSVSNVTVSGTYFSLTEAFTPISLGLGESTTFTVEYTPTSAGTHTGTITINDNRAVTTINLNGTATDPTISTFPWIEDFGTVSGDWPVQDWTQRSGLYPTPTGTSTQWVRDEWLNGPTGNNAAKINIYGTSRYGWLVTPPIAIPATGYELMFDLGLTRYGNTTAVDPLQQSDDKFIVAISDSPDMSNPTLLKEWNNIGSADVFNDIPNTGTMVIIDLDAHPGLKYIAFYGESTATGGDNDLFVDNVSVRESPLNPIISINPDAWDYETQIINTTTPKEFTITNTGAGSLDVSSISVTGTGFALAAAFSPVSLLTGESASFMVNFAPVAEGTYSGNIAINSNIPQVNIVLNGTALDATIYAGDLPHIENFDAVTAPAFPLGWEGVINSTNTFVRVETYTSSTPYSAPNHVYIYNSGDATADLILVSPPVDVALNTLRTKFMAKGGSSYSLDVGTWDGTTFTLYENLLIPANYAMYSVNFSGYTGSDNRIAFRHGQGSTYRSIYLDDVVIEVPAPVAPEPATVLFPADGITTLLNPMLQWTPSPTGEPAISYKVYLNQGGIFSEDDLVYEGADLQFQTTDTVNSQEYFWKVAAINNFGFTDSATWSFNTPGQYQLAESFEGGFPPAGWSKEDYWYSTTSYAFHGTKSVYRSTSAIPIRMITPPLDYVADSKVWFQTYVVTSDTQRMQLSYQDGATWTNIGPELVLVPGAWQSHEVDLGSLDGNSYKLGLGAYYATGGSGASVYLDHVIGPELTPILPNAPTLTAPANAAVNQSRYPKLTWNASTTGGVPAEYNIYLDTVDGSTLFDTSLTTSYSVINPLDWDTTYFWKVAASNNAGEGAASDVRSFTTMSDPTIYTLPFDEGFEEGNTHATAITGWMQEGIVGTEIWTANNTLTNYNRSPRTGDWNAYLRYGSTRWMFKPVQLAAGVTYRAIVYAKQDGATATDASIGISYGAEPNADGMTEAIIAPTGIINGDYQKLEGTFTPDTAGIYYVGIVGEINFGPWYISIDDIRIDEAPTGPPDPVTLISPEDEATGLPIDGFNLTWAQAMTGGYPETYAVLMSMNEGDLSNDHYWDGITDTSFDPTQAEQDPIAYEYGETWYWTVIALNEDGDALQETASSFTIMDDPRILSLPYSENFDAVIAPAMPAAWTAYVDATTTYAYIDTYSSTSYAVSQPNAARLTNSSDTSADLRLITPDILVPINSIKLSFSARGSSGYTLLVGTVDALDETGTFTQLASIDLSANHEIYSVSFASYAGTDQNICFKHGLGGTYRSIYIDDVMMEELVANDLAVVSLTGLPYGFQNTEVTHTVTVKNNGTNTQNSYTVYLKSVDGRIILGSEVINEELLPEATKAIEFTWSPSALGALEIYGEVVLAGDAVPANNVSENMTFNTYEEGILFESFEGGVIPSNWTVLNEDGDSRSWEAATTYPRTGNYAASCRYGDSSSVDNDDWLITPPLQLSSSVADHISFWIGKSSSTASYTEDWEVLLSSTDTNPSSFTMIDSGTIPDLGYIQKSYDLDSYFPGDTVIYLALRYRGTWDWYLHADDFVGPPIYVPTSLAQPVLTVSTSGSNVVLDWEAIPYARSYQIEAADAPEGPYTLLTTVTGNTYSTSATSKKFFKVTASTEGIRAMTQQPLSLEQQLLKDEADRVSNGKN